MSHRTIGRSLPPAKTTPKPNSRRGRGRISLAALAVIVILGGTVLGTAAEPAPPPRLIRNTAPVAPKIADRLEVIVFAPHRPIRITVTVQTDGKPLHERWRSALRKAFDLFDRDGDDFLNGSEVQFIFQDAALTSMMVNGSYAPNPADLPTIDGLDTDGDRRVSFDEFVAYYKRSAAQVVRGFPPQTENESNAQATEGLFKLFDRNGDGKLTKDEVTAVEKLLPSLDADEDECLSLAELLPNSNGDPRLNRLIVRTRSQPPPIIVVQNVSVFEAGRIPGTITQRILKQYDKDGDFELTRAESGFDPETFARLDIDRNGKLSGEELDAWRTGPADLEIRLSLARIVADCQVEVITDPRLIEARGFTLSRIGKGRAMIRHARQPIEFWVPRILPDSQQVAVSRQQLRGLFQQAAGTKGYVLEKDLLGPAVLQYQQILVMFDPADRNGDGKLTQEEFNRYLDTQQPFLDLSVGLIPMVQTPTLFQLLDENRDGRLGVRELRTAWDRLTSLEPPLPDGRKAEVVTRAAIQPTVSIRLTRSIDRTADAQFVIAGNPNPFTIPLRGPVWFQKMDRNGDGDVSRTEFLGTKAEFDAIDTDHDGLISFAEAEAYDKMMRTATKE